MCYLEIHFGTLDALEELPPPSYSEVEDRPFVYIINIGEHLDEIPPPNYEEAVTAKIGGV